MLQLLAATEIRRPRPTPNLQPISQRVSCGRRSFAFGFEARAFSDGELLGMCGYVPELGGSVDRSAPSLVTVTVHTD